MKTIKFMKYYVTDGQTKARIFYSHCIDIHGKEVVTLYAKDYNRVLNSIFKSEYENDSDMMTDYFEHGRVRLYKNHPLYNEALKRCK